MAITAGGNLNSVPASQKQTLSTNYLDFTGTTDNTWAQQYVPDLMEKEAEIFGKRKANQVVIAGIFASFFSMLIILLADLAPAIDNSPINDRTFHQVIGLSPLAVLACMLADLFAQFIDTRIFHFWKKLTKGKHLWLRYNFSTFASQFIDTFTVVSLLSVFGTK